LIILGSYLGLSALLYVQARYWLPVALPTAGGLLTHLSLVTYRGVVEQRERFRVRSIFSKVVSPDVVNELLNLDSLRLGGTRRMISVYFADIRGFTTVTDESHARAEGYVREHGLTGAAAEEYLDGQAREILATVNLYLGMIADCVKRHSGTFDKYIGDCAMAFWGAPTPDEHHAVHGVRAAVDAQQAIYRLNCRRAEENQRHQVENQRREANGQPALPLLTLLSLGSGVNTGVVTVGLMGSDQHGLNYTVFGREVNLASRLEGISGRGRIIIGVSTYRELERHDPELAAVCLSLPPVAVKGFREPVAIYEVDWRRLPGGPEHYDTGMITGTEGPHGTDFSKHPWAQTPPTATET
jgi:adenylate cyclase